MKNLKAQFIKPPPRKPVKIEPDRRPLNGEGEKLFRSIKITTLNRVQDIGKNESR